MARARRVLTFSLVSLLLAANAVFLWHRRGGGPTPDERRLSAAVLAQQQEQQDLLRAWNADDASAIEEAGIHELINRGPSGDCFSVRAHRQDETEDVLDPALLEDLVQAVGGLLRAVHSDDPAVLVAYMEERGKSPEPRQIERYRKFLIKNAQHLPEQVPELERASAPEILARFWAPSNGRKSHWAGIVLRQSCWRFWRADATDGAALRQDRNLVESLYSIFPDLRSWSHSFTAGAGREIEDAVLTEESVLVSDWRILIEHDESLGRRRAPYLIRFWYSPFNACWQPIVLVRINTFPQEQLANPMF